MLRPFSKISLNFLKFLCFSHFQDNKQELQSVLKEAEQSQKLFLQRLFPEIKASEAIKGHNEWLDQFAFEVNKFKEESKQTADKCKQEEEEEKPSVPAVDDEQLQKLEGQVKHYKSVLAETVSKQKNTEVKICFQSLRLRH